MKNSEDLRIVKTKIAIKTALLQLMSEKPFEKITVADITNRALIHRGTFYSHYKDKLDLIEQIENDVIDDFSQFVGLATEEAVTTAAAEHSPLPHVLALLDYIENHPDFFKLIAENNASKRFYEKVTNKYFEHFKNIFRFPEDKWLDYRKDIVYSMFSSIFNRWVCTGMKEPKEDLASWITELLLSNWRDQ